MENKNLYFVKENLIAESDSVLLGHTKPVTGIKFFKDKFLSCSMDCTLLIWEREGEAWMSSGRLGQYYGNKNSFFGVQVDGENILAWTFTGACY